MHMGRKLTVLWDEGELGNSVMLLLAPVVVADLPNVPYRLNAQLGILLEYNLDHLCLSQFQLDTSPPPPPGNPRENFLSELIPATRAIFFI